MKKSLFILLGGLALGHVSHATAPIRLSSPDGGLKVDISTDGALSFEIFYHEKSTLNANKVQMILEDGLILGDGRTPVSIERSSADSIIKPVVPQKAANIRDHYNQLTLAFDRNYQIIFRAYDTGIAYRFSTSLDRDIIIRDEVMDLEFPSGTASFFPEEKYKVSHNECLYPYIPLAEIDASRFCSLPVMADVPGAARILFTEADLFNYPSMYLKGGDGCSLHTDIPRYVLKSEPARQKPDRHTTIVEEADYIARSEGNRNFPWRVFVISDDDGTFLETNLVFQLSRPLKLENTEWIRPGKVAWDWYNANNIMGVDFESGLNTETYKYYIDFAASANIEYIILDEGWSISTTDISKPNPELDLQELIEYGKKYDVGIILWALWRPVDRDMEYLFDLYQSWGIKGVKIDFMARNDQWMVEFYERTVEEAAKRELLIDFHGAFKPVGLHRTYPNLITYEGVKGAENNKWSDLITPTHNVTIPFTRMAAGPMDYTPGSVTNVQPKNFFSCFTRPMAMGTRANMVAKYVVFESALQMLCESPSLYKKEMETVDFITAIPTTWDETRALEAKVGEYLLIARRKGEDWFIGGMTNEDSREMKLDLSFLPKGTFSAKIMQDGTNAAKIAIDYKIVEKELSASDKLSVKMAPSGGWAAILRKN